MGEIIKLDLLSRSEAEKIAKLYTYTVQALDAAMMIEIYFAGIQRNTILIDRNTNVRDLAGILEGSYLFPSSRPEKINERLDIKRCLVECPLQGLWLTDTIKMKVLLVLTSIGRVGYGFKALEQRLRIERSELIKAIEELLRAGLVVKAATGGLWWVGAWRQFCAEVGYLIWLSPGMYAKTPWEIAPINGKMYGSRARKNFSPAKYYTDK